jgi:hypothetical protein
LGIGTNFVGALAYADDIVWLFASPSTVRKLLAVCESFALDYKIVFNASKSNCLVITPSSRRDTSRRMNDCSFSIGDRPVNRVNSYVHLGHTIKCQLDDSEDIRYRRICFIGRSNNALCYFNKLDLLVRIKLFLY